MADVLLSTLARADLEDIRAHGVEAFGEAAAERQLVGLRSVFVFHAEHPMAGQARPEFRHDIRSLPHRPHRILYTVTGEIVLVVRVIHQARDVASALDEAQ